MADKVKIKMPREVVARMVSTDEPLAMRVIEMGPADAEGAYAPDLEVLNLVPLLPQPWVFDGYRRIYDNGRATKLWQARAVDLTDIEIEPETGREKVNFISGQGRSISEALEELLEAVS